MNRPGCNVDTDWWEPPKVGTLPNGTTPYTPGGEVSLIHEMVKMPDCQPTYLHGGQKVQPWVIPQYGMSTEVELEDLMYCLVRLLKPNVVLETGCFLGYMTYALGRAVQDNRHGQVVSCDVYKEKVDLAQNRCQGLPVKVLHLSALDPQMDKWYQSADIAFLDADEGTRPESYRRLKSGCLAVIHDTNQEPWVVELEQQSARIDFVETWRGFTMMRKQ